MVGSITHWDLLGGTRGGTVRRWGGWGDTTWGEMPDIGDGRGMEAANQLAMHVSMQQSCMICTCTPEPKVR